VASPPRLPPSSAEDADIASGGAANADADVDAGATPEPAGSGDDAEAAVAVEEEAVAADDTAAAAQPDSAEPPAKAAAVEEEAGTTFDDDADAHGAAAEEEPAEEAPASVSWPYVAVAKDAEPKLKSFIEPMHDKHRVNWHLEYAGRLPDVIESPAFSIHGYEPLHLMLHPFGLGGAGSDCVLSLSGPSPRPSGMKAMLFLGKGWAKRAARDWPDGTDLQDTFPSVDFAKRRTILCGLVYQVR